MSTPYFHCNFKHSESYKENYLLKKSALALARKKTDPISHTSRESNPKINFRPGIKTEYKTLNKPTIKESFNNIFVNKDDDLKRSHSKKTYNVTKNSPSEYVISPYSKRVFPDKNKNIFNINEEANASIRPKTRKENQFCKPSNELIQFNNKQFELPANYYKMNNIDYKTRNRTLSRSHSKSKIIFSSEDLKMSVIKSPKKKLHPFIQNQIDEILSYKDAMVYRLEALTPKINSSSFSKGLNINESNSDMYRYFKERNQKSNLL